MAHVVIISNPYNPRDAMEVVPVRSRNMTIRSWLRYHYGPAFKEFSHPTVCSVNGKEIMRKDWNRRIRKNDVITFLRLPGAQIVIVIVIIALSVAISLMMAPNLTPPKVGDPGDADPAYSLKGQRNQVRLGQPKEVIYGRVRAFPSIAASSYNRYINNESWLYQLFCVGQGEFYFESVNIEETPIENFTDVEYEIVPPGGIVTIFPDNVYTSQVVGNLEMFGPNEPEYQTWLGPYSVNPAHTRTDLIEIDVTLPQGLYKMNKTTGDMESLQVTALFEYQEIDDIGQAKGAWQTFSYFNRSMSTNNPQRITIKLRVPSGRYQIRGHRTNNADTTTNASDTFVWETLRCFMPSKTKYENVTMLAVKARASNNLNQSSASRINAWVVRKLQVWDEATGTWNTQLQPTRSIAWAFADAARARYGGRLADKYLDIPTLIKLDKTWAANQEFFDWVFDQRLRYWDVAKIIAQAGRATPLLQGPKITLVRDEPRLLPVAIFNQDNIVKGSFRRDIKIVGEDQYDGLEVTYMDKSVWKEETVLCCMPDENGDYPQQIKLNGISERDQAYHLGMYRRAVTRKIRENISWTTGLEGFIPFFGDVVRVSHDIPEWGIGGQLTGAKLIDANTRLLYTTEPLVFEQGKTYSIELRRKDGSVSNAFPCTQIAGQPKQVRVTIDSTWQDFVYDGMKEPPLFAFGENGTYSGLVRVMSITPTDEDTVDIAGVNIDPSIFENDALLPPPIGNNSGSLPQTPQIPQVTGTTVIGSPGMPNEIVISWRPASGAQKYTVELSYDGESDTYNKLGETTETSFRTTVYPKYIYVRVAAVNVGQGAWDHWLGQAPIEFVNTLIGAGEVPNAPVLDKIKVTQAYRSLYVGWEFTTNAAISKTHIYVSESTQKPAMPTVSITYPTATWAIGGLEDKTKYYFWLQFEGVTTPTSGPVLSAVTGPIMQETQESAVPEGETIKIVDALPSTGNKYGSKVFLTTDNKTYTWVSKTVTEGTWYWDASVKASDISGQLTAAQIAEVNAAAISGQITQTQISDSAITTSKIAANAIVADKIGAGAILADKIAANAISSDKIQANAIEAGKIAAGAVSADKIGANAVTADKIQAGAVTASKMNVVELSAITANVGLLMSSTRAQGQLAGYELDNSQFRIYDDRGVVRVELGRLL